MSSARTSVPGEDLPGVVAGAFTVIGVAAAVGAALVWTSRVGAQRAVDVPWRADTRTVAAAPSLATALPDDRGLGRAPAATSTSSPRAPASTAVEPSPRPCPPLVIQLLVGGVSPPKPALEKVAELGRWLVAHDTVSVVIDGHADATGGDDTNLRLSRQRASFVALALEHEGVDRSRVTARGFGSFWPMDEAPPDASWNRRVVVQTKGGACPREKEEVTEP